MAARPRRHSTEKGHAAVTAAWLFAVLAAGALAAPAGAAAQTAPAGGQAAVLLLFDSSKSMAKDAGGGQTRIDAAKRAAGELVDGLPSTAQVGLRAYGSRVAESSRRAGCRDTRNLVPVGPLDRDGLHAAIDGLRPTGRTPIGRSLRQAPDDFPAGAERKTVILVSDGGDNCAPPDPCRVAADVAKQGVALSIQVIGLQVSERVRDQLRCIARAGAGTYVDAGDPEALLEELRAALARAFRTYGARGKPVEGAVDMAAAPSLHGGEYLSHIRPGEQLYYAVPVPMAKRVWFSGTVIAPREAAVSGLGFTIFHVGLMNPDGTVEKDRDELLRPSDSPVAAAAVWGRVPVGESDFWARPGRYVFRVELEPQDIAPGDYPLELAVHLLDGDRAPSDRPAPPSPAPAAPAAPARTTATAPAAAEPGAASDDGGDSGPRLAGAGIGGLVLGGLAGTVLVRRRRR